MGTTSPEIDQALRDWIVKQPVFFVGTAPSSDDGHVNISPKGDLRSLAILGERRLAYVDFFGSGIETVAHLKQNGRIVVMLCAFQGPPKIVRIHGCGRVVEMRDPEFAPLMANFDLPEETHSSIRSIITVDVTRVSDSCGFVVPELEYVQERGVLFKTAAAWTRQRGPDAIRHYCDVNNAVSIDGLRGLSPFGDGVTSDQRQTYSSDGRKL